MSENSNVLRLTNVPTAALQSLVNGFGIDLQHLRPGEDILGSFWGAPEAGIIGTSVLARPDTPVHSLLHEMSHIICMAPELRKVHQGNAGSDDSEESAVCFLQIVLADLLPEVGSERLMSDMDVWGYSLRLGSTRRWFAEDASDERAWLQHYRIVDADVRPTFRMRQASE